MEPTALYGTNSTVWKGAEAPPDNLTSFVTMWEVVVIERGFRTLPNSAVLILCVTPWRKEQ